MLSIGIFVNNLFTFLVSDLTFFQSLLLTDGNVVFFSAMISFTNTWFFPYNICFIFLRCMLFRFSVFCASIQLGFFCFLVSAFQYRYGDLVDILLHLIVHIFLESGGKKTKLSLISFLHGQLLALNLADSVKISTILFLQPFSVGLLL